MAYFIVNIELGSLSLASHHALCHEEALANRASIARGQHRGHHGDISVRSI